MRLHGLMLGAGLFAAAGAAATGLTGASSASERSVVCQLHARHSGGAINLTAVASSGVATAGDYRLVVTKRGAAGGSDIEQSGGFSVSAGGTSTLSQVTLSLEPGAAYDARLTVNTPAGRSTCSQALPANL